MTNTREEVAAGSLKQWQTTDNCNKNAKKQPKSHQTTAQRSQTTNKGDGALA